MHTSGMQAALVYMKYASTFPAMQQTLVLSNRGAQDDWGILNIVWCAQSYKFFADVVSAPKTTALMQQNLVT